MQPRGRPLPQMRYAVVVGATGLTGQALTQQLAADRSGLPVRALLRRPAPALPARIEQIILPRLDDADALAPHIPAGAWVFCCVGTTMAKAKSQAAFRAVDLDIPVALAHAAAAAGADGMSVVSSVGAKAHGFFFYNRVKGEMELSVQATHLPSVHIFRPGLLLGKRPERRLGERLAGLVSRFVAPMLQGPLAQYAPIHAGQLAKAMIAYAKAGGRGLRVFQGKALRRI